MTYCPLTDDECRNDCEWAVAPPYDGSKYCVIERIAERLKDLEEILEML